MPSCGARPAPGRDEKIKLPKIRPRCPELNRQTVVVYHFHKYMAEQEMKLLEMSAARDAEHTEFGKSVKIRYCEDSAPRRRAKEVLMGT